MAAEPPAVTADAGQLLHASGVGRGRPGLCTDGATTSVTGKFPLIGFTTLKFRSTVSKLGYFIVIHRYTY